MKNKPNIIVILVDDMGFSDIGCYGSEIPTPSLDGLAKNGVRFSQFYNTARCCPTRASLLTGLYPHQAGVGHMTDDKGMPGYSGRLNDKCATMAEVLQPAGYLTAMVGKWHVGQNHGVTPTSRGFERSLHAAAGGFYYPDDDKAKLFLNGKPAEGALPKDWYSSDLWVDYSVKFLDEARTAKKPLFLYLAFNAPHFPLQAPAEEIAKFRGKYRAGWDKLRADRLGRQKSLGLAGEGWALATRPEVISDWEKLPEKERDRFDHLMATYAACVSKMDSAVGRLVAALKERGELDNTLILFMSDNGGNAESGPNGRSQGDPSKADSSWFCGQSWAWLQNTPFREYKHYTHEGGISTPLIAHWPTGIPRGRNGKWESQPGHLIDILATVTEVGQGSYPGGKVRPKEGVSLLPAFSGKPLARKSPLFWEHEGNRAVREGRWKLVAKENQPWELYDIQTDRSEQTNLAAKDPARVQALSAAWDTWAKRADVLPLGGWRGKQNTENVKNAKAGASTATRFTLKSGDSLEGTQAPAVVGKTITITAQFESMPGSQGVVVAQGGAQNGYSLFVQEGKLHWALKSGGALTKASLPLPPGAHSATATLTPLGELTLTLDGASATAKAASKLAKQPVDGLDVGKDTAGAVGPYTVPFAFTGTIRSVEIKL
ncbi:arylsulfatase [Armatimonas sp.]|uniref:arylsulfatase n=1 Tax=Armatimonas sp. TaxID=1872638 RepID=UPI00286C0369|nr:arylsulfatase [Armatimonas sp.]